MSTSHIDEDVCLEYLTGELSEEQKASFDGHLGECAGCRQRVEQYREILRDGLPSIAEELIGDMSIDPAPWSAKEAEKRLYAAIEKEASVSEERRHALGAHRPLRSQPVGLWLGSKVFVRRALPALGIAASVLVAFGLANSIYRLGVKHGTNQSHVAQAPRMDDAALRAQLESLMQERDAIRSGLGERSSLTAQLRTQLDQQRKQNKLLEESLQDANQQGQEQAQRVSAQRDELARKLEDQETVLATTQKKLDTIQQTGSTDALRVVSLENRIQQMADLLKDKDSTIEERDRMLASRQDVWELMGARDLYMAEVSEVGVNGKKTKPYGRVFLTKGKSLIYYAYDLDQQPGLRTTSTVQAWGMRGPDPKSALHLGVMYIDNAANKRWCLQFDDPKVLAEINAVFITVEPDAQSRVPRGKPMLVAYLKEEPNHP